MLENLCYKTQSQSLYYVKRKQHKHSLVSQAPSSWVERRKNPASSETIDNFRQNFLYISLFSIAHYCYLFSPNFGGSVPNTSSQNEEVIPNPLSWTLKWWFMWYLCTNKYKIRVSQFSKFAPLKKKYSVSPF